MEKIGETFVKYERPITYLVGGVASSITAALLYCTPLRAISKILFSAVPIVAAAAWAQFGGSLVKTTPNPKTQDDVSGTEPQLDSKRDLSPAKPQLDEDSVSAWEGYFLTQGLSRECTITLDGEQANIDVSESIGLGRRRHWQFTLPIEVFNASKSNEGIKAIFLWERSKLEHEFESLLTDLIKEAGLEAKPPKTGRHLEVISRQGRIMLVESYGSIYHPAYLNVFSATRDEIIELLDYGRNKDGLKERIRAFENKRLSQNPHISW